MKIHQPLSGALYLFRGFQYVFNPKLRHFVLLPAAVNVLLFSIMMWEGFHLINMGAHYLPSWLHWLAWIAKALFFIICPLVLVYFFTIITNLIGAPFNSFLSEKTERLINKGTLEAGTGFIGAIKDIPRIMKREWHKIWYYLPRMVLLLILFVIPVVNAIAGIAWFVFSAWMMCVQYIDYPLDNHRTSFAEMRQYLGKHRIRNFGFGCAVMLAAMVPILNFFVMPAAVIGATLMWIENP